MRARFLKTGGALALVAGSLLTACGGGDDLGLAALAPPDAPLYAEVAIEPDGEGAEAIAALAERVGGVDDVGGELAGIVDSALVDAGADANYADDVEPWLGSSAAVFVSSFEPKGAGRGTTDFALELDSDDSKLAREFAGELLAADPAPGQTRSYGGHEYEYSRGDGGIAAGIVGEALVIGTETAFKVAVDAEEGESLAQTQEYAERVGALADDRIATVLIEPGATIEAAIASEDLDSATARTLRPLFGGPLAAPVAIGLTASENSVSLDLAATLDTDGEVDTGSQLLAGLPASSWIAAAVPELGSALEFGFEEVESSGLPGARALLHEWRAITGIDLRSDVTGWLGDTAAFAAGTGALGFTAGLIAETDDPEGPRGPLAVVERLAERTSGLRSAAPPEGSAYGFSLGVPGLGGGAEAGVFGDRLVAAIGTGAREVLDPGERLGDDGRFQAAVEVLGDGFAPALYVHLPSLLEVAELGGAAEDPDYAAAAPYLDALGSLIVGSRAVDGLALSRLTVSLAQ